MIPRATFLALGLFGVFVIGGVWTLTHAISPARLQQVTAAGGMPITEIAQRYWGRFSLLIPITAISASLGIAIATSIGASRILFSMSRSGLTHRRLAELSPVSGVPRNAMHCIFAGGLLAAVLTAAALGPYRTYVWWGTTSTFFAMVTYLMVNAAHLSLFRERARSSWRAFVLHSVAPLCGIAIDLFILVRAFAIELWRQGWAMGQSILLFDVGCALLFAVVALTRQTARPRSQGTD
jgi:amino acid transporter